MAAAYWVKTNLCSASTLLVLSAMGLCKLSLRTFQALAAAACNVWLFLVLDLVPVDTDKRRKAMEERLDACSEACLFAAAQAETDRRNALQMIAEVLRVTKGAWRDLSVGPDARVHVVYAAELNTDNMWRGSGSMEDANTRKQLHIFRSAVHDLRALQQCLPSSVELFLREAVDSAIAEMEHQWTELAAFLASQNHSQTMSRT